MTRIYYIDKFWDVSVGLGGGSMTIFFESLEEKEEFCNMFEENEQSYYYYYSKSDGNPIIDNQHVLKCEVQQISPKEFNFDREDDRFTKEKMKETLDRTISVSEISEGGYVRNNKVVNQFDKIFSELMGTLREHKLKELLDE